jgi:hypothetical protein
LSRCEAEGARRLELINNLFAPCALEAGHSPASQIAELTKKRN